MTNTDGMQADSKFTAADAGRASTSATSHGSSTQSPEQHLPAGVAESGGTVMQQDVMKLPESDGETSSGAISPTADAPLTMDVLDRKLEEIRVQIVAAFSEDQINALLSKLQEELTAHMQTIDESMNAFLREHVDPLKEQVAELRAGGAPNGGATNGDHETRIRNLEARMKFM